MRLAILGDIHAFRLRVAPWDLLGKRLIGQTNLWLNRRHIFNIDLLDAALTEVMSTKPDILMLSGDLTTTARKHEFLAVGDRIARIAPGVPVLAVPGNHDRYTIWSRSSMKRYVGHLLPDRFPDFRPLQGRWHYLGLDAAVPHLLARGHLGHHQRAQLAACLEPLTEADGVVVMCHYPFAVPDPVHHDWGHALSDEAELRAVLASCRARIVYLHGHIHIPWYWQPSDAELAHVQVINAGSPCHRSAKFPRGQGFWRIDLADDPQHGVTAVHHHPEAEDPHDWAEATWCEALITAPTVAPAAAATRE